MAFTFLADGTITSPAGFRATGIHSGLKTMNRDRDLGLLISKNACTATAHLGTNSGITGAWSTANLRRKADDIRAVLILTGVDGGRGAEAVHSCHALAALLADEAWIKAENVLMLAAGESRPFDMELLKRGIPRALDELDSKAGHRLAAAMTMLDESPRMTAVKVDLGNDQSVMLGGLAAGPHPGSRYIVTTDATMSTRMLNKVMLDLLERYGELDQSSVVILASGTNAEPTFQRTSDTNFKAWREGLFGLMAKLLV